MNDIYSWNKELKAAEEGGKDSSHVVSAVRIISQEMNLPISASKRILWSYCRELELVHETMVAEQSKKFSCNSSLSSYIQGLEYLTSGNETWSRSSKRYHF